MNKQRLIELLTEQAFDIYDYHRRNPEFANHLAVRDLLIECREVLNEHTN
jgi:hypothetical protein